MTNTQHLIIHKLANCKALTVPARNILADIHFHHTYSEPSTALSSVDIACIAKIATKFCDEAGIPQELIDKLKEESK